jgi:hypothetical protein
MIPGLHRIFVKPGGGYQTEIAQVRLAPGQFLRGYRLVYDFAELLSISGRVLSLEGTPLRATVVSTGSGVPDGYCQARTDGTFQITGLVQGEYVVVARASGFAADYRSGVHAGTTGIEFVLEPLSRIRGRVTDQSGRPITTYRLTTKSYTDALPPEAIPVENNTRLVANAEGQFRLELQPGTYRLEITADGFLPSKTWVDTTQFEEGDEIGVALTPE